MNLAVLSSVIRQSICFHWSLKEIQVLSKGVSKPFALRLRVKQVLIRMTKVKMQPGTGFPTTNGSSVETSSYGSRLLPTVVDELAHTHPERVYATIPISSDISQGFRDVTMSKLAQSVNYVAFWLEKSVGRSDSFETLAYIGVPDVRYTLVFLAAVKCGYKVRRDPATRYLFTRFLPDNASFSFHQYGIRRGLTYHCWSKPTAPNFCIQASCLCRSKICRKKRVIFARWLYRQWKSCSVSTASTTLITHHLKGTVGILYLSFSLLDQQARYLTHASWLAR